MKCMNAKVSVPHQKRLFRGSLLNNYLIMRCPEVCDKCSRSSQISHIFTLLGVYSLKIKQFPERGLGEILSCPLTRGPTFSPGG